MDGRLLLSSGRQRQPFPLLWLGLPPGLACHEGLLMTVPSIEGAGRLASRRRVRKFRPFESCLARGPRARRPGQRCLVEYLTLLALTKDGCSRDYGTELRPPLISAQHPSTVPDSVGATATSAPFTHSAPAGQGPAKHLVPVWRGASMGDSGRLCAQRSNEMLLRPPSDHGLAPLGAFGRQKRHSLPTFAPSAPATDGKRPGPPTLHPRMSPPPSLPPRMPFSRRRRPGSLFAMRLFRRVPSLARLSSVGAL